MSAIMNRIDQHFAAPIARRIRQNRMLAVSHRMGDLDCSLRALEELHPVDDPAQLVTKLLNCAKMADIQWMQPEKDDKRVVSLLRLASANALFTLGILCGQDVTKVSNLLLVVSLMMFVKGFCDMFGSKEKIYSKPGKTMNAAEAEAWLVQHATEARMLHARRALILLISCDHFRVTQDKHFNQLLDQCISMYLYLLHQAEEHPMYEASVQAFIQATLPELVKTVLHTDMHSTDPQVQARYAASCCFVMRHICREGGRLLKKLEVQPVRGHMNARGMAAQFFEMQSEFVHDGLIDELNADGLVRTNSFTSIS